VIGSGKLFRTGLNGFCGEMQSFPRFAAYHSRVAFIRDIGEKLRGRLCNAGGVTEACRIRALAQVRGATISQSRRNGLLAHI